MQTTLSDQARQLPRAAEAERILRSCVHCGFCNATCPTYQLLGDELDGPRGRIYLIKQVLEGQPATVKTQQHLDRCLSCRNCETTCPSGVDYHNLLDIGRALVDATVPRPLGQRLLRQGLRALVPNPSLFKALISSGKRLRPLLPQALQDKLPRRIQVATARPGSVHARQVLLLEGCVQPGLSPNTNAATARVLDRLGIGIRPMPQAGCCGAVDYHLDAQQAGLDRARRNIDAWWPLLENGAEAIVQTASGCGAFVKDYAHLLAQDPRYAAKAERVSAMARDLCCGSAGTYSLTQPELARQLRDNKLSALESGHPDVIVTANIGCQSHLDGAGRTPVRHWIELVDDALPHHPPAPRRTPCTAKPY